MGAATLPFKMATSRTHFTCFFSNDSLLKIFFFHLFLTQQVSTLPICALRMNKLNDYIKYMQWRHGKNF